MDEVLEQWIEENPSEIKKVIDKISGEIFKNYKVSKIIRSDDNIRIMIGNEYIDYDQVVLASHADESLDMLEKPTTHEKNILGKSRTNKF